MAVSSGEEDIRSLMPEDRDGPGSGAMTLKGVKKGAK